MFDYLRHVATPRARDRRGAWGGLLLLAVLACGAASVRAQTQPSTDAPAASQPTTAPAGPAAPSEQEKAALDTVAPLLGAKRYAEALTTLEPLAQSSTAGYDVLMKTAGAHDGLALEAAAAHQPDAAAREQASAQYKEHGAKAVEYYLRAGSILMQTYDPRAESIYERALYYEPRRPEALLARAMICKANRNGLQAIYYYREYVKTDRGKGDYDAQLSYASLLIDQGTWRQAVRILDTLRTIVGVPADRELARAYVTARDNEKALSILNTVLRSNENDVQSRLLRAALSLDNAPNMPPLDDAIYDVRRALDLCLKDVRDKPEDNAQWLRLGETIGNVDKIIQSLRPQLVAGNLSDSAAAGLARIIADASAATVLTGKYDLVTMLSRAGQSERAGLQLLTVLAENQSALGMNEAAATTAERILKLEPDNALARQLLEKRASAQAR